MKESKTLAVIVTIKELQKEIWVNTKEQYMKESNIPCGKCEYKATTKKSLTDHQRAVHAGVRHLCGNCDYQASHKGHLTEHERVVHERVKYPCSNCDYQATKTKE